MVLLNTGIRAKLEEQHWSEFGSGIRKGLINIVYKNSTAIRGHEGTSQPKPQY
jgi:hypothetical protein